MSDIVDELRDVLSRGAPCDCADCALLSRAADEIERLRTIRCEGTQYPEELLVLTRREVDFAIKEAVAKALLDAEIERLQADARRSDEGLRRMYPEIGKPKPGGEG